jgi:hypothetical protein
MSGYRRLALSGIALTALLAVVALASRAHHPGGGSGAAPARPPALLLEYWVGLMMVLFPIGAIIVIWALAYRRHESVLAGKTNWRRSLMAVGLIFLILGVRLIIGGHLHGAHVRIPHAHGRNGPSLPSGQTARRSDSEWLPALVLGSLTLALLVTGGYALMRRQREGEAWAQEAELAAALDEVLEDTLNDLRAEADPRLAVIRTYRRMEETFAAYGVPRKEAEAPREFLERVLDRLNVSKYAVRTLTHLFARAKFSTHEIDAGMKEEAIEALVGLRAELEHGREAA